MKHGGDPGVVQDLLTHCFSDSNYLELGHIGVGVRILTHDFVFQGSDSSVLTDIVAPRFRDGLILADTTGGTSPSTLPGPLPLRQRRIRRASSTRADGQSAEE